MDRKLLFLVAGLVLAAAEDRSEVAFSNYSLDEEKLTQLHRASNQPYPGETTNWSKSNREKNESISLVTPNSDEDEKIIDNKNVSWPSGRKLWWQLSRIRPRGYFSFDTIESIFSFLGKVFVSWVGPDAAEDAEPQSSAVNYKDHQLIRLSPKNKQQVQFLEELKESEPDDVRFWTFPATNRNTDVLVSPSLVNDVIEYFEEKKMDYTVMIPDLQKVIKAQNPKTPRERRQDVFPIRKHPMTWKRYHRYDDIEQYMDYLASEYPHLAKVQIIGKSYEDRPLKIIKISSGPAKNGEPKPAMWIDAGMHAREWISTAVATYIINQLVEKNQNYTRLLELTDWIIMPVANPDGYEYTHTDDRLWRKTRSVHESDSDDSSRQGTGLFHMFTHYTKWLFGTCEGVDPNRNFNIHWGEEKVAGASLDPCHDTYAGPTAFSELETKAIADYIMKHRKNIRTYLTLHSYSQMLLVPWGFTYTRPADFDNLMNVATKAKKAMAKVHGTEYRVGPAAELLYPTTGSSDDWAKAVAGINYAYTLELRDRGQFGFLLPASQIIPTSRETWAGVRVIARMSAASHN